MPSSFEIRSEVAFTGVDQGGGENGGFDADDGAVDTLFEYNWTHDNSGGSVNVVADPRYNASPNYGTVVRFNVSENDGARVFAVGGTVSNTSFVNNTAYVPKGKTEKIRTLHTQEAWRPRPHCGRE
jgi:hypothetical protein